MAPVMCFLGCEGNSPLFCLPADPKIRHKWEEFVFAGRQKANTPVYVCSRHFADDCFVNKDKYEAGFATALVLKEGAAPSVPGRFVVPQLQPSATHYILTNVQYVNTAPQVDSLPTVSRQTQICPQVESVGSQVVRTPSTKSVATQLSSKTLKERVRSKGTQATVSHKSVGTVTTHQDTLLQCLFTHVKDPNLAPAREVRRAKRARVELTQEKEEEEEVTISAAAPHSPAHDAGASREKEPTTEHSDVRYIVSESCLKDLFRTCPVCKEECEVTQRLQGTCVSFSQLCPSCLYSRKWQSQPTRGDPAVENPVPENLCSQFDRQLKEEVIAVQVS